MQTLHLSHTHVIMNGNCLLVPWTFY